MSMRALRVGIVAAGCLGLVAAQAAAPKGPDGLASRSPVASVIADGGAYGSLDAAATPYVPARHASGYLIVVPKSGDFDSTFVSIVVRRNGKVIGEIRSGIVYWLDGRCVIGFAGMQTPERRVVAARGFVDVAAIAPGTKADAIRPGQRLFIVPDGSRTFPVTIDHRITPPSDDEDDD